MYSLYKKTFLYIPSADSGLVSLLEMNDFFFTN